MAESSMTELASDEILEKPWEALEEHIDAGEADALQSYLDSLGPAETAHALARLDRERMAALFKQLPPDFAADMLAELSDAQLAEILRALPAQRSAAILEHVDDRNRVAHLLASLDTALADEILTAMTPDEAHDVRPLMEYPEDTAGGIMITEFVSYREHVTVGDVLADLQEKRDAYSDYEVQYFYITDDEGRLTGVLPLRDLLFAVRAAPLTSVMISQPLRVRVDAPLDELRDFFREYKFLGVPVVDENDRLLGVLRRAAVEEAVRKRINRNFLKISGIMGGEEFRSMPLRVRSGRRLSWLTINIGLNIISASVIALYEDTLSAVIALAVFLPIISDMSGCSGNQAVAVSMRELSLGMLRPRELFRVWSKEAAVGIVNGLVLGAILGAIAWLWKGNFFLGAVVGGALGVNTLVAVSIGGCLPLILKRLRLDPALVSGPMLTTVTDMCGFFLALSFATLALSKLA